MLSWIMLILSLALLVFWAGREGRRREADNARLVFSKVTNLPSDDLADCLMDKLPLTGRWVEVSEAPEHIQGWNPARHLRADIESEEGQHRVSVATPLGRPLRDQEAKALRQCLEPVQSAG
ncbi:hypothetical protein [Novosphingobium sp. SG751A]|uniref:hypothetical protein n=1 Tax=Novosphingobium sp. SG751A TaxID=2587000 RepID=UPI00155806E7|nr:hypothetical protein [Novosphingobium sp. SG751A]